MSQSGGNQNGPIRHIFRNSQVTWLFNFTFMGQEAFQTYNCIEILTSKFTIIKNH